MSDPVKDLSAKNKTTLKQFRENVGDVLESEHDDYYLVRWLRARSFDLKKAEAMLRKHVAWRKRNNVDKMLLEWEAPEVLAKYYPGGFSGFDKEGCPIFVDCSHQMDMKGVLLSAKKSDILKFNINRAELAMKNAREQGTKLGKRIDKITMISDMEKWTLKLLFSPGMGVLLEAMAMAEANYPEVLKVCYVVNAPKIFPIIFNLCKPMLSEDTKQKIVLLGGDYKQKLLEIAESDQLPGFLGGTLTDPDGNPLCTAKICQGGRVPESYYLGDQHDIDRSKLDVLSVSRGSTECLTFEVTRPGAILNWVFVTECYDIKFGVLYKQSASSDEDVILKPTRVNSHMVPEDGVIECTTEGIYVLKFDNSYSWVHSKKVSYNVQLTHPDDSKDGCTETSENTNL